MAEKEQEILLSETLRATRKEFSQEMTLPQVSANVEADMLDLMVGAEWNTSSAMADILNFRPSAKSNRTVAAVTRSS